MSLKLQSQPLEVTAFESSVFISMNIVSLVGNAMICLALLKAPRLRTTTNLYIVSLACSDLLCAVCQMPLTLVTLNTRRWIFPQEVCEFQAFIDYVVVYMSPATMGLAALNRYFRIVKTEYYNVIFSSRRSKVFLGSLWTLLLSYIIIARGTGWQQFTFIPGFATCTVIHLSGERGLVHYSVILLFFFVLPFSISVFSYYHVYKKIRQHNLEIVPSLHRRMTEAGISIHEIKITKSLSVVIAGFAMCWVPMWTITLLKRFHPGLLPEKLELLSTFLIFLSATINPFIYAWTSRGFRVVILKMLSCLKVWISLTLWTSP